MSFLLYILIDQISNIYIIKVNSANSEFETFPCLDRAVTVQCRDSDRVFERDSDRDRVRVLECDCDREYVLERDRDRVGDRAVF